MARAQFDRDEVIDKSIELFWENGFSASSMKDVVQATGLKPGSIYLAFGNKKGLFKEALEGYAKKRTDQMRSVLDSAASVGEGLCTIIDSLIEESTKAHYSSCFLIKTRLELAAEDNELYNFASDKLSDVEAVIESYLRKEFSENESQRRAASVMLHIFGLRVYGYRKGSVDRMHEGVREGLPWLPWK